jgi:hypothetical protein
MKKSIFPVIVLVLVLALSACASKQPAQANNGTNPTSGPNGGGPQNSLESMLAAGTLKLEGTDQAVTADEAKQLLPLWQQVKTMTADSTTNPTDLTAVYQQIEKGMTTSQIQAIQNMSLTQTDLQNLMQTLGIQVTPGSFGNFPTQSADQLATRQALGTPAPGSGSGNFPTLSPDERSTRQAARTLTPGANNGSPTGNRGGGRGFGFSQVFIDPLIQLLQTRSGQ